MQCKCTSHLQQSILDLGGSGSGRNGMQRKLTSHSQQSTLDLGGSVLDLRECSANSHLIRTKYTRCTSTSSFSP